MRYQKRKKLPIIIIVFFTLIALTSYTINVFFRVKNIDIEGDVPYQTSEILNKISVEKDDCMILLDKENIEYQLTHEFPYIGYVEVMRIWPDTVYIEVSRIHEFAAIYKEGIYYSLDVDGKIIDEISEIEALEYPMIYGLDSVDFEISDNLSNLNDIRVESLVTIIQGFKEYELESLVNQIDVEKTYDLRVVLNGKYQIKFGSIDNFEHKMKFLQEVLAKLTPSDIGTIDLSDETQARFIPGEI